MLPPVMLPEALTMAVLTLPELTLPVTLANPVLTLPELTLPVTFANPVLTLPELTLPVTLANPVLTLPESTFATVMILPPMMLPMAVIRPAVAILAPLMLPTDTTVAAVTLPVTARSDITLPVKLIEPVLTLPELTFPVTDINPAVLILPPMTLPVALTYPVALTFRTSILPVKLRLEPVAAPIFGVVKFALALTATWFDPLIVVVSGSTLTLNCVPFVLRPLPAVYAPAPENCVNTIGVVPTTIVADELFVHTHPVSKLTVPYSTKVNAEYISTG